jgi:two-component system chemotaxis sensor kinase CheA
MLTPLLAVAGYSVTTAEDANAALKMRDNGEAFDVIISDIEMPGMSGFEFAEAVKNDERWHGTPIVALSSHTAKGDLDRGREVGFADYVAKFDRDALLNSLSQTLASGDAA